MKQKNIFITVGALALLVVGIGVVSSRSSLQQVNTTNQLAQTISTSPWSSAGIMPTGVAYQAMVTVTDGRAISFGGKNSSGTKTKVTQAYNPSTNTWSTLPQMSKARVNLQATQLSNGKVLITGGQTGSANATTTTNAAQLFNPTTNTWTSVSNMITPRHFHQVVPITNGNAIVIGGLDGATMGGTNKVEKYNSATNSFTALAPMANKRNDFSAVLDPTGTKIYAIGGSCMTLTDSVEVYTIATNTWQTGPSLLQNGYGRKAVALSGGKILIMGGSDCYGNQLASAEMYDPAMQGWSPAGNMPYELSSFTATLIGTPAVGYKVMVVGGTSGISGIPMNHTALYNVSTNQWSSGPDTTNYHAYHSTTALQNGSLLVAGGTSGYNSAEKFTQ